MEQANAFTELLKDQAQLIKDIITNVSEILEDVTNSDVVNEEIPANQVYHKKQLIESISLYFYKKNQENFIKDRNSEADDDEILNIMLDQWFSLTEEKKMELTSEVNFQKIEKSKKVKKVEKLLEKSMKSLKEIFNKIQKRQNGQSLKKSEQKKTSEEENHITKVNDERKNVEKVCDSEQQKSVYQRKDESKDEKCSIIANPSAGQQQESFVCEEKQKKCQSQGVFQEKMIEINDDALGNITRQKSVKVPDCEKIEEENQLNDPSKISSIAQKCDQRSEKQLQPCTAEKLIEKEQNQQ